MIEFKISNVEEFTVLEFISPQICPRQERDVRPYAKLV